MGDQEKIDEYPTGEGNEKLNIETSTGEELGIPPEEKEEEKPAEVIEEEFIGTTKIKAEVKDEDEDMTMEELEKEAEVEEKKEGEEERKPKRRETRGRKVSVHPAEKFKSLIDYVTTSVGAEVSIKANIKKRNEESGKYEWIAGSSFMFDLTEDDFDTLITQCSQYGPGSFMVRFIPPSDARNKDDQPLAPFDMSIDITKVPKIDSQGRVVKEPGAGVLGLFGGTGGIDDKTLAMILTQMSGKDDKIGSLEKKLIEQRAEFREQIKDMKGDIINMIRTTTGNQPALTQPPVTNQFGPKEMIELVRAVNEMQPKVPLSQPRSSITELIDAVGKLQGLAKGMTTGEYEEEEEEGEEYKGEPPEKTPKEVMVTFANRFAERIGDKLVGLTEKFMEKEGNKIIAERETRGEDESIGEITKEEELTKQGEDFIEQLTKEILKGLKEKKKPVEIASWFVHVTKKAGVDLKKDFNPDDVLGYILMSKPEFAEYENELKKVIAEVKTLV